MYSCVIRSLDIPVLLGGGKFLSINMLCLINKYAAPYLYKVCRF